MCVLQVERLQHKFSLIHSTLAQQATLQAAPAGVKQSDLTERLSLMSLSDSVRWVVKCWILWPHVQVAASTLHPCRLCKNYGQWTAGQGRAMTGPLGAVWLMLAAILCLSALLSVAVCATWARSGYPVVAPAQQRVTGMHAAPGTRTAAPAVAHPSRPAPTAAAGQAAVALASTVACHLHQLAPLRRQQRRRLVAAMAA